MHTLKHLILVASSVLSFTALAADPVKVFPGWPADVGPGEAAKSADPAVADVTVTKQGIRVRGKKDGRTTIAVTQGKATRTVDVIVDSAGWQFVQVMVAKVDVEEGTTVTADQVEQRGLPAFLFTTSAVRADSANYILGQRVLVPVQAGDVLQWSQFESPKVKK
jgi:flagella basal body P-ring formation protein FlgA